MQGARIVAVTQPRLPESPTMTAEEFIIYCARVSSPQNQTNTLTAPKLVEYLVRKKHWSPFEMVNVVLEIKTTRDVGRQILRHSSFKFQEFSQRYAPVNKFGEPRPARLQDLANRQNSIDNDNVDLDLWWYQKQMQLSVDVNNLYNAAVDQGIAKEVARCILPEGLTPTTMYVNGTLRSWIHYLMVRMERGVVQAEHCELAEACFDCLNDDFPNVFEAVNSNIFPKEGSNQNA